MLIFLDIDGVMVPAVSWKVPENLEDGFPMFTEKATTALRDLISNHTDVKVVLSTSHRDRFTIDQWRMIFKKRGIDIKSIDRLAPNTNLIKKRKEEIEE